MKAAQKQLLIRGKQSQSIGPLIKAVRKHPRTYEKNVEEYESSMEAPWKQESSSFSLKLFIVKWSKQYESSRGLRISPYVCVWKHQESSKVLWISSCLVASSNEAESIFFMLLVFSSESNTKVLNMDLEILCKKFCYVFCAARYQTKEKISLFHFYLCGIDTFTLLGI